MKHCFLDSIAKSEPTLDKLNIIHEKCYLECSRISSFVTASAKKDPFPVQATCLLIAHAFEERISVFPFSVFHLSSPEGKKAKIFERDQC